jgi:hypothetical protein
VVVSGPDEPLDELRVEIAADVRRVADRLRTLSDARLAAPLPPAPDAAAAGPQPGAPSAAAPSRAAAGWQLAADLAAAGQGLEERAGLAPPQWRPFPRLSDLAVGDQVAVTGQDVLAALADAAGGEPAWAPAGRSTVLAVAQDVARALADLRRRL